jgi:hypothetical protein
VVDTRSRGVTVSALAQWRRRLLSRSLGEDPENHRTWVLDDLWRAACNERAEEEWQAVLRMKPLTQHSLHEPTSMPSRSSAGRRTLDAFDIVSSVKAL